MEHQQSGNSSTFHVISQPLPTNNAPPLSSNHPQPHQPASSKLAAIPTSRSSKQHHPEAHFNTTFYGNYCVPCKKPVGFDERSIRRHVEKYHNKKIPRSMSTEYARQLLLLHAKIRESTNAEDAFLFETVGSRYVCRCSALFDNESSARDHCNRKGIHPECTMDNFTIQDVYSTHCGRVVPASARPVPRLIGDFEATRKSLEPFIRNDEELEHHVPLYVGYVYRSQDFGTAMKASVSQWKEPVDPDTEPGLADMLDAAQYWLENRARITVRSIPGDMRWDMINLLGQDVGGMSANFLYNFRHKESTVLHELLPLIRFAWRSDSPAVTKFKNHHQRLGLSTTSDAAVDFLCNLMFEQVDGIFDDTVAFEYCLARCFRVDKDGNLSMVSCGNTASHTATVLSLLRAAVCSKIASYQSNSQVFGHRDAIAAGKSRFTNQACPFIRAMRDHQEKKGIKRHLSITPDGHIAVDKHMLTSDKWEKIIPTILDTCLGVLSLLYPPEQVRDLFKKDVTLDADFTAGGVSFKWRHGKGAWIDCSSLKKLTGESAVSSLSVLHSYVELIFSGTGMGSVRHTEICAMETHLHLVFHNLSVYFSNLPIKKAGFKHVHANRVVHKVPRPLAVVVLLFLHYRNGGDSSPFVVPPRDGQAGNPPQPSFAMKHAAQSVLGLDSPPTDTQLRHLWIGIHNILFPKSPISVYTSVVTCEDDVAEMSGHSSGTHAVSYSSSEAGALEAKYEKYHKAIGYDPDDYRTSQLRTSSDLYMALRCMYGPGAQYRDQGQSKMIMSILQKKDEHLYIGLPCGSGKSLAWLLPALADTMHKLDGGMVIVAVPHNFLAATHMAAASKLFGGRYHLDAKLLSTSQASGTMLPDWLQDECRLPCLLFMGLDALEKLVENHKSQLSRWIASKRLSHLVFDEIHCLITELFRSGYEKLRLFPLMNCRVVLASGTLPVAIVKGVLRYVGISTNLAGVPTPIIVPNKSLFGKFPKGFRFECRVVPNPCLAASQATKQLQSAARNPSLLLPAHHMCTTKSQVEETVRLLRRSNDNRRVASVTSDTAHQQQQEIAASWRSGKKIDSLVTTSIGVMGNENPDAQFVTVQGTLYGMLNNVQSANRLRSQYRTGQGAIFVFLESEFAGSPSQLDHDIENRIQALTTKGILDHSSVPIFKNIVSHQKVYEWTMNRNTCRVVYAESLFGFEGSTPCGVCDNCLASPVALARSRLSAQNDQLEQLKMKAHHVLRIIAQEKCIVCDAQKCNGETCLPFGACFCCGLTGHRRNNCPLKCKWKDVLRSTPGSCHSCFDNKHCAGFVLGHDPRDSCRYQRRLKRIIIQGALGDKCLAKVKDVKQATNSISQYVVGVLSSSETFYGLVSQYCQHASSPSPP